MDKTASPISSTPRTAKQSRRGFTLVEVLISTALSSVIFAGVMSTFLMMGRSGANAQNYVELEAQARKALDMFSREARLAYNVTAYSGTSVTLAIPDNTSTRNGTGSGAYSVTYAFNSTAKTFTRTGPPIHSPSAAAQTTTLITNVLQVTGTSPFNYYRYVTGGGYQTGFTANTASNAREIKQIELNFVAQRNSTTVATASDRVLSARFILRNK